VGVTVADRLGKGVGVGVALADRGGVGVTTLDLVGVGVTCFDLEGVTSIDRELDGVIVTDCDTAGDGKGAPAEPDAERDTGDIAAWAGTTIVPMTGDVQLVGRTVTPIAAAATS
jgi:hypothetical protein